MVLTHTTHHVARRSLPLMPRAVIATPSITRCSNRERRSADPTPNVNSSPRLSVTVWILASSILCGRSSSAMSGAKAKLPAWEVSVVRTGTKTLSLAWLGLILAFSITTAFAQQSDKSASDNSAKPTAAPRKAKKVWTNDDIPSRSADSGSGSASTTAQPAASGGSNDPVPKGASKARPAKQLMKAWANRSLWVKNPPVLGGCECFDFKNFDDCQIWSFDENMRMTRKGGRLCDVREFIADKEPGHVPGDYGLIIGGIGDTYIVSFPKAVTETTRTFAMRDTSAGWSFEVFDGPCSGRAK